MLPRGRRPWQSELERNIASGEPFTLRGIVLGEIDDDGRDAGLTAHWSIENAEVGEIVAHGNDQTAGVRRRGRPPHWVTSGLSMGLMRRLLRTITVVALVLVSVVDVSPSAANDHDDDHQLFVMADSVVLGARSALVREFPDRQVTVAGVPAIFTEVGARRVTEQAALVGDIAIAATGYNYPYWDPERFRRSIDLMVQAMTAAGAEHVIWVNLRTATRENSPRSGWFQVSQYAWYFPTVNQHLVEALDRHPNLSIADWEAVSRGTGLTYDAIHVNSAGAALMARVIHEELLDVETRHDGGEIFRLQVAGVAGVPADAEAVALNVTATEARNRGFVTLYPCDRPRPTASSVNITRGATAANLVVADLAADGTVCLYTQDATHLVVDLAGWFPAGSGLQSEVPQRILDTRDPQQSPLKPGAQGTVPLDVGAGVGAVALNVTTTEAEGPGFVTVYPCDQPRPLASNVNTVPGRDVPNLVLARPDADGRVCLYTHQPTHLVVDRLAAAPRHTGTELLTTPQRLFDTRVDGTGARLPRTQDLAVEVVDTAGVPGDATAVWLNVTVDDPAAEGFLSVRPCGTPWRGTSNLNFSPGQTVANAVLAEIGASGQVCVFANADTHVIVDIMGWVDDGTYRPADLTRLHDSRPPPLP